MPVQICFKPKLDVVITRQLHAHLLLQCLCVASECMYGSRHMRSRQSFQSETSAGCTWLMEEFLTRHSADTWPGNRMQSGMRWHSMTSWRPFAPASWK